MVGMEGSDTRVWVPGRVVFLVFKRLISLFVDDVFLGRPMLPRTQPDYAGMPMVHPTGKTRAIGGQMDGCNMAIVIWGGHRALSYDVLCFVFFFASVKLAKRRRTGVDRPWRPPSSHGRHGPPLPTRPHATSSHNILR